MLQSKSRYRCEQSSSHQNYHYLFHCESLLLNMKPVGAYFTVYQNLELRIFPSFSLNLVITPYFPFFAITKSVPKPASIPSMAGMPMRSLTCSDLSGPM